MSMLQRIRGAWLVALLFAAAFSGQLNAAGQINLAGDGWYTWRVASVDVGADERIFVRVKSGKPKEIEVAGKWCNGHWGNKRQYDPLVDLGLLDTDESIDWLRQYIGSRSDLSSDALAAISVHAGDRSLQILISIVESDADHDIREEAVFWMAMSESDAAFDYIDGLLTAD